MNAGGYSIRTAAAADVDAIVAIAQACFGASAWGAAHFAPHPARTTFLAETPRPSLVANCIAYSVLECVGEEAELQAIAVLPDWRRRHVGQALLERARAEGRQRGARHMFLEVRESNLLAQYFYRRFDFAACGTRPSYYRAPEEAAVVMRATL